jgi:peptide/nickel transport system permease protein
MKRWLLVGLVVATYVAVAASGRGVEWQAPSLQHPFGTDEYGRDALAVALLSALVSGAKGAVVAGLAVTFALGLAVARSWRTKSAVGAVIDAGLLIFDSVPLLLWLLVLIVAVPHPPTVLALGFSLGTLPFLTRVVAGELQRQWRQPFVSVARMSGASRLRVAFETVLPNALPVLRPVAIQVLGSAAAAEGLIGLVGVGNREQLGIGTMLIRGREHILIHPLILVAALLAIFLLFASLRALAGQPVAPSNRQVPSQ